jgi:hypothetical protein
MKISKGLLLARLMLAVTLSGLFLLDAHAQDNGITDSQIQLIRNSCVSTKNTLNQLHVSDALLRVNMGQRYESMSTKLMSKFNDRVANNSFSNTNLTAMTTTYEQSLDTFRSDYKTYEEQMSATINIDCLKQPTAFYNAITSSRNKRNQVHSDIVRLNQYLDQYQSGVEQFEKNYLAAAEGAKP